MRLGTDLGTDLDSDFLLVRLCTGKTEVHLYTLFFQYLGGRKERRNTKGEEGVVHLIM